MIIFSVDQLNSFLNVNIKSEISKIRFEKKKLKKKNIGNVRTREVICMEDNLSLYRCQKWISKNFFKDEKFPDVAYGYIQNKSYFNFLNEHRGKKSFLRLDIKNFFDSIPKEGVQGIFQKRIRVSDVEERELINIFLLELSLYNDKLAQGYITSPIISNIYFRDADKRISQFCINNKVTYSRYVDDLLFSSDEESAFDGLRGKKFISTINYILKDYNLELNTNKIKKSTKLLSLNGFVVEEEIRLSRKKLKKIVSMLFFIESRKKKITSVKEKDEFKADMSSLYGKKFYYIGNVVDYLTGIRSFLIASKYNEGLKWEEKVNALVDRIEKSILLLYKKFYNEIYD